MKIILFLFIYITLFSADQIVSREGDVVTVVSSGEYIMGDSDNRKESRTMALTQAKVNASEIAGTYIESNFESIIKQTNDDKVEKITKKELRSFSAAILQSEIIRDTMELLADKTTVYKITIKAKIDLATLRERVKQIGEDKIKKDKLISLEKENKELSDTLQKLSKQMKVLESSTSVKLEDIRALRDERDQIFSKIENIDGAVKIVFEQGSIKNEYEQKIDFTNELYKTLDSAIYKHLGDFFTINFFKPSVVEEDGDSYILRIDYYWTFEKDKMLGTLEMNSIEAFEWAYLRQISLYSDYYEGQTVKNLMTKFFQGQDICLIFSLPKGKKKVLIGEAHGLDGMYRPFVFRSNEEEGRFGQQVSSSISFTAKKSELTTFSEVTANVGYCKEMK